MAGTREKRRRWRAFCPTSRSSCCSARAGREKSAFGEIAAAVAFSFARDLLSWSTLAAMAPGLAMSLLLATRPPAPTHLRTVGWTLVSVSALTAAIVVATRVTSG